LLATPGIEMTLGATVSQLRRDIDAWHAFDVAGRHVGRAAVVVVASALDAPRLAQSKVALQAVPGRLTCSIAAPWMACEHR